MGFINLIIAFREPILKFLHPMLSHMREGFSLSRARREAMKPQVCAPKARYSAALKLYTGLIVRRIFAAGPIWAIMSAIALYAIGLSSSVALLTVVE